MPKFTTEVLTAAIEGFESQKRHIDEQIAELRQMLGGSRPEPVAGEPASRKQRTMSAAARARIAAAQRKRWAASKKAKPQSAAPKKRQLSAAGRKRIVEATKARWARVRAAAEKPALAAKKVAGKASGKTAK